ncbi:MAG: GNAT family N-acetyltransferase [Thermodesulfovibrionales bacterium]
MKEIRTFTCRIGEKITLRPAQPEDAASIIDAVRSTSEERSYVLMDAYGKDVDSERKYIEQFDRCCNLLLVAEGRDGVIGSLAALEAERYEGTKKVMALSVGLHLRRECRGHGIGSAMLRYALQWGREHGYKRIEADIFTTNKQSLRLFSKAGFKEEPGRTRTIQVGMRQIHEVLLVKKLR